jgi:hypothetical protein
VLTARSASAMPWSIGAGNIRSTSSFSSVTLLVPLRNENQVFEIVAT